MEVVYLYNGANGIATFDPALRPELLAALKEDVPVLKDAKLVGDVDVDAFVDPAPLKRAVPDADYPAAAPARPELWLKNEPATRTFDTPAALLKALKGADVRAAYVPDAVTGTLWFADKAVWVAEGSELRAFVTPHGRHVVRRPAQGIRSADRELRRSRRHRVMTPGRRLLRVASLGAALVAWQLLTSLDVELWLRFGQFPTVGEVAAKLAERASTGPYWQDLVSSLSRIVSGFALAAVLGVAVGTAIARSRVAADVLGPVLEVLRPIPAIALVPVAILLFPSNEQGIVFITCTAAFFPVLVSTRHAVAALSPVWEEAVLTMGGGRGRILLSVIVPGALPGIFGGLSVGIGVGWICVISAEMISGEYGVGYRTWQDYTVVDYPGVFVGMATIGALGWLTSTAVERLGRRLTHWLPTRSTGAAPGPSPRPRPARPEPTAP